MLKIAVQSVLLYLLLWCFGARAEVYLTPKEAIKVCLPEAAETEIRKLIFTPEQRKEIQRLSGIPLEAKSTNVVIGRRDGKITGYMIPDRVIGKHYPIDYAVALEPDGTIRQVEILEYRESYGWEIKNRNWRDQFKGKNPASKPRIREDISNISGATLSCSHVTDGVRRCLAIYEVCLKQ